MSPSASELRIRLLPSATGASGPQYTTSFLINDSVVIDAGSIGIQGNRTRQMSIEHVLITHTHADHTASLPILIENAMLAGRQTQVWGSRTVLKCLRQDMFNDRVWPDLSSILNAGEPFVRFHELEAEQPQLIAGLRFTPIKVTHTVHTLGFLIESAESAVLVPSDTGPTERVWELANGAANLAAVFLEASFPNAHAELARASLHLTPEMFGNELEKLQHSARVVAVHLKAMHREQIIAELNALGLECLEIGAIDEEYAF
jgi:ribonuclease BN (tRNA processing enzyme)